MKLATYFERQITDLDRDGGGAFVLVHPRSFTNVCFWWVPPRLRPFRAETATPEQLAELAKVYSCSFDRACVENCEKGT